MTQVYEVVIASFVRCGLFSVVLGFKKAHPAVDSHLRLGPGYSIGSGPRIQYRATRYFIPCSPSDKKWTLNGSRAMECCEMA